MYRYSERMPDCVFTTASGVHAVPLAEFCMLAMFAHSRDLFRMLRGQAVRQWERFAATDLTGRTLGILGMGAIGRELARRARHTGLHVLGIRRRLDHLTAPDLHLDALFETSHLAHVLPRLDYLVLAAPATPQTWHMIGAREFDLLPAGAFLINVGRGSLVDEGALVGALESGRLSGAALDVFEDEPLPVSSLLWSMPNVIISPHSASTSDRENPRITDLFCENLDRFLHGAPLRNVYDPARAY
ncbi:MAG: D-2-hydroxyacid dehydrogenase [Gemmatimonadetes bacterium]|nr:D-2-hydroxyacid dehydrogenase [Gemmatimonadota bacterium]